MQPDCGEHIAAVHTACKVLQLLIGKEGREREGEGGKRGESNLLRAMAHGAGRGGGTDTRCGTDSLLGQPPVTSSEILIFFGLF